MTNTNARGFRQYIDLVRQWLIKRYSWFFSAFIIGQVTLLFLAHAHVLPEAVAHFLIPKEQLPAVFLVLTLLYFLIDQLEDYTHQSRTLLEQVQTQNDELVRSLQAYSGHLLEISDCVSEIEREIKTASAGEPVQIDHLGLDMRTAWNSVQAKLLKPLESRNGATYRLLMLAGDGNNDVPKEAIKEINTMRGLARQSLENITKSLPESATPLRIQIRIYKEHPIIHGFCIRKPQPRHFVSFFRWEGKAFDVYSWSGKYHRILTGSGAATQDLGVIFDGYFEHLWQTADVVYPLASTSPEKLRE